MGLAGGSGLILDTLAMIIHNFLNTFFAGQGDQLIFKDFEAVARARLVLVGLVSAFVRWSVFRDPVCFACLRTVSFLSLRVDLFHS